MNISRASTAEVSTLTPETDPMVLKSQGEISFHAGEQYRQVRGMAVLADLLRLGNEKIYELLGIREIPFGFDTNRDWLWPTGVHPFEAIIGGKGGRPGIEIIGVRIQDNVVDRDGRGKEQGLIIPIGGGVRVTFVPTTLENGVWWINDADAQRAKMMDEGGALAAAMVPKNTALRFRDYLTHVLEKIDRKDLIPQAKKVIIGGGGKADLIIALPASGLKEVEQDKLTAKALFALGYQLGKQGAIGPSLDRLAGDVGTTGTLGGRPVVEWIVDGYLAALYEEARQRNVGVPNWELMRAVVSGKQVGGLETRTDATGLGTWEALKAYAEAKKIDLEGKTVFFRGCGSAAHQAIKSAAEAGMKVTAVATRSGLIICRDDFTASDADELYQISVEEKGSIIEWARKQEGGRVEVYFEADSHLSAPERAKQVDEAIHRYWQEESPEVIFESATQMTINKESAQFVPRRAIIVEGGNGVTTPEGLDVLKSRDVVAIPGILANAAGVFVSWFEWAQAVLGVTFPPVLVKEEIGLLMQEYVQTTLALMEKTKKYNSPLTMEEIFYSLAIARGLAAKMEVEQQLG